MDSKKKKLVNQLLIFRCQIGDRKAIEELILQHQDSLLYFINCLLGDHEVIEDIFQDTWLTVIRQIHTLKKPDTFPAWLYRIARNKVYQEFRRKKVFCPLDENIPIPNEVEEGVFSPDDAANIHKSLKKLSQEHKEVLVLRFLSQMSYQTLSEVLNCNHGTVKSRIYYAKRALKKEMEK